MSNLPAEEERIKAIEQARKFNLEYEVYDKKLMYGVDVISALNKADSSNEKYILGKFLSGGKDAEEFIIDVVVTTKKPLTSYLTVNYIYNNGMNEDHFGEDGYEFENETKEVPYMTGEGIGSVTFDDIRNDYGYKYFVYPEEYGGTTLKSGELGTYVLNPGTYHLLYGDNDDDRYTKKGITDRTELKDLIDMSDYMRQTVQNTRTNESKIKNEGWSSFEWKTTLYDLKNRKFKCVEVHYSEKTGRINRLAFEEI